MSAFDILPDIHGQADLLAATLSDLGYRETRGAWRHPDADRRAIFLGDFIDRGPKQAATLDIVRRMTGEGVAMAVMGNHEMNALLYHATDPETGLPLRRHGTMETRQHARFLAEFPIGAAGTRDALSWMAALPLYLELPELRVVHACWHAGSIAVIDAQLSGAPLDEDRLLAVSRRESPLRDAVDKVLKGLEVRLPNGVRLIDKDGHSRKKSRVAWWARDVETWGDAVASWPDDHPRPEGVLAEETRDWLREAAYPADARPVFFGHYWLVGTPHLQAPNALCLDYSAGKGGPMVGYRFDRSDARRALDLSRLTIRHPASPSNAVFPAHSTATG